MKKMTKEELVEYLIENYTNEHDIVDLRDLDFGDKTVFLTGMKAAAISQSFHEADEIHQSCHNAKKIFQTDHDAKIIYQIDHHASEIYQNGHNADIICQDDTKKRR